MPHQLHVVLIEPEIPQNTGSIGRLCLATGTVLHLVGPMGFEITDRHVRRAGLDYWKYVDVRTYESTEVFLKTLPSDAPVVLIETGGTRSLYEHRFEPGTYIVLGKETTGIPKPVMEQFRENILTIPMYDDRVRSINLSNCASVVVYEAIRQLGV